MKNFKKLFGIVASMLMVLSMVPVNVLGATYTSELTDAYDYGYEMGITTKSTIDSANMYGSLLRSHMAKMMSNYAVEVIGLTPDTSVDCDFSDMSNESAEMQDYAVEACQLGLMGLNSDGTPASMFNPNGIVTRAQFGTVLSRALYGDMYNGGDVRYADHLDALKADGVMNNISNPNAPEVRGFVMLMMMRADEAGVATNEGSICNDDITVALCAIGDDACPAECLVEEEEEEVYTEEKAGQLDLSLDAASPDSDVDLPVNVSRTTMLVFEVEADGADVVLHNLTLEFVGYGDYTDVDDVTIYNSNNIKVSKTKDLSDTETTISFENNVVVKEGGKETFTVAAEIVGATDTTYGISVVDIDTSAEDTNGLPVVGSKMKAVTATNVGELTMNFGNAASSTITVWETEKLGGFKLKNDTNYEDVTVYSIMLTMDGVDEDIFDDLVLYADGQEVADDLEFYNDELVANIDYTIEKESAYVEFELFGSVSEIDDGTFTINVANEADIYAKGDKYGFNANIDSYATTNIGAITIEGSEVVVSFDKSSIDEAKPDAEDVLLGTLKLKSLAGDYDINSYSICLDATDVDADEIKDLTLWGNAYDDLNEDAAICGWAGNDEYVFEDISLPAGQQVTLQLVIDFEDTVDEDDVLSVDVSFDNNIEVEDDYNDVTYDETDISDIFSTVSFNDKDITIEWASFDSIVTTLNARTVVLGNQEELVYKGKITIGDADDVTLTSIDFTDLQAGGEDLNDIIQSAILTIGDQTYADTDIEADKVEFDYINHEFAAGDSNVVIELVVKFKSKDGVAEDVEFAIDADSDVVLEDSEGDELAAGNITVVNTSSCVMTLTDAGELTISFENDDNSSTTMNMFTEQDKFALAGSEEKVVLAKLKLDADQEDMEVETLVFEFADVGWDFYNSYENIYFQVVGNENFIGDDTVTYLADVTTIELENLDFVVSKDANTYAYLYATVKATDLNPNAAEEWAIAWASVEDLELTDVEFTGESSGDDENTLTLNNDADDVATSAYDTTVVMNTLAMIELQEVQKTLVDGLNLVVWKLVVTPVNQDRNLDADGDAMNAFLAGITITGTPTDIDLDDLTIRKVGWSVEYAADGTPLVAADALEIDGTVTYEILADLSNRVDVDASLQLQIADITADVVFTDGNGADLTLKLSEGISREYTVSTN